MAELPFNIHPRELSGQAGPASWDPVRRRQEGAAGRTSKSSRGTEGRWRAEEGEKREVHRAKAEITAPDQSPDEYLNQMESICKPSEASSLSFKYIMLSPITKR